jgi:LPS-assembly protein
VDYDPKLGQFNSDNLYAGYSWGRTTMGVGHALLDAIDEKPGTASPNLKNQIVTPFFEYGKQSSAGLNLAANAGYDYTAGTVQYWGAQGVYNWDCCGLTFGYRKFELGSVGQTSRDEHEWLYSFTLANFTSVGDIRRSNSVFRDLTQILPF